MGFASRPLPVTALNELEVLAVIGGVEMTLAELGVPVRLGSGAAAAEEALRARERVAR